MREKERNKVINVWLTECRKNGICDEKGKKFDENKMADVYYGISHASKEKDDLLMELANAENCIPIFRTAAIDRLTVNETTIETALFLRELVMDQTREEKVRAWAYKMYRYIRVQVGLPSSKVEREHEKSLISNDSDRMRWLMSLND